MAPEAYIGDHGIAAEKLLVSRYEFDNIKDLTRLGRC